MTDTTDAALDALVARLMKRAAEDQQIQSNNETIAAALKGQRILFDEGFRSQSNTFAVRMQIDHENCAKRDAALVKDWQDASDAITALRAQIAEAEARGRIAGLKEAADLTHRVADGYDAGGDKAIACGLYLTEGNIRALIAQAEKGKQE